VGRIKGAKPPQRRHAAGFRKASDPGKRSPSSLSPLPPQWVYDGQHWCGRVEVINGAFVAVDINDIVVGKFETLLQATRALPAGGAP
jgi:hypothetical protein